MSTAFEVPLSPMPQKFSISLANVTYNLKLRWNDTLYGGGLEDPCWLLDISDATGDPILTSLPLVTGTDLLAQYGYLNFGGQLVVQSDNDPGLVPDFTTLGKTGHLYFVTTP
jgi:hypothetical protein